MSAPVKLPRVPSALIRLALADLAKVEAMPDLYEIDMVETYHSPRAAEAPGKCSVCLAGSIMAMSLHKSPRSTCSPYSLDPCTRDALVALNLFRSGRVADVFLNLELTFPQVEDSDITPYTESPAAFRLDMEQLAADLEAEGF